MPSKEKPLVSEQGRPPSRTPNNRQAPPGPCSDGARSAADVNPAARPQRQDAWPPGHSARHHRGRRTTAADPRAAGRAWAKKRGRKCTFWKIPPYAQLSLRGNSGSTKTLDGGQGDTQTAGGMLGEDKAAQATLRLTSHLSRAPTNRSASKSYGAVDLGGKSCRANQTERRGRERGGGVTVPTTARGRLRRRCSHRLEDALEEEGMRRPAPDPHPTRTALCARGRPRGRPTLGSVLEKSLCHTGTDRGKSDRTQTENNVRCRPERRQASRKEGSKVIAHLKVEPTERGGNDPGIPRY